MLRPSDAVVRRQQAVRRVLGGILVANLVVVVIKFSVGLGTKSLAVLGDAIQSSVDVGNNLFGLALVRLAAKAPDEEHPYGHAKFETLGALLIVVFLSVTIFELVRGAIERLLEGSPYPRVSPLALVLMGLTLLVNLWVVWFETRAARRLGSELLLADALHTRTDLFVTLAALSGLGLAMAGYPWADPALALVVAGIAAWAGYEIVRRSLPTLVDEAAIDAGAIRLAAEEVTGVHSAYAIRSRVAGPQRFAELTISVDGEANVAAAHRIADDVEQRLRGRLRLDEVVVHVEPC
jgi:cation diffusion facilitator family transporter